MQIKAFRGWRFNPEVVGDPGLAISPPYDVIDEEKRKRLCAKSPYNIVQVIRPEAPDPETEGDNRYTRAADIFRKWRNDRVVLEDPEPSIYVYGQTFEEGGRKLTRLGFAALCALEEFGEGIRPHEWTMGGPKMDRLKLTRATRTQFGHIFVLYLDPEKVVDAYLEEASRTEPLLDATDEEGVRHVLWSITDPKKVKAIERAMASRTLLIADGHHRYETALTYAKENRDLQPAQFQIMTMVNTKNEGMVILPTHRMVKNVSSFQPAEVLEKLGAEFVVEVVDRDGMFRRLDAAAAPGAKVAFGVYLGDGTFHLATLKDPATVEAIGGDHSDAWKHLDVTLLHVAILDRVLGIGEEELDSGEYVEYIKGVGDAVDRTIEAVDSKRCQAVFYVNPPRMEEVEAVAEAGDRMPRKSTFFHPKVFSGLVMHVLE